MRVVRHRHPHANPVPQPRRHCAGLARGELRRPFDLRIGEVLIHERVHEHGRGGTRGQPAGHEEHNHKDERGGGRRYSEP